MNSSALLVSLMGTKTPFGLVLSTYVVHIYILCLALLHFISGLKFYSNLSNGLSNLSV